MSLSLCGARGTRRPGGRGTHNYTQYTVLSLPLTQTDRPIGLILQRVYNTTSPDAQSAGTCELCLKLPPAWQCGHPTQPELPKPPGHSFIDQHAPHPPPPSHRRRPWYYGVWRVGIIAQACSDLRCVQQACNSHPVRCDDGSERQTCTCAAQSRRERGLTIRHGQAVQHAWYAEWHTCARPSPWT